MQALQSSAGSSTVLSFGGPVQSVQDPLQHFIDQFELNGRSDFDRGKVLKIELGRHTKEEDIDVVLAHLKDDKSLVLNIACVSITFDKVVWTTDRQRTIQEQLPRDVTTIITVYDSDKRIQETSLLCEESNSLPVVFASFPVDLLLDAGARYILSHPNLQTLIILPPMNPVEFLQNDLGLQEELIRLALVAKQLRKIRLPLDFSNGIKNIIRVLKEIESLRILELEKPASFEIHRLPRTLLIRLDNALLRALDPFPQLERLSIDKAILSAVPSNLLLEMSERLFEEKVDRSDGQFLTFQKPVRHLFHISPSFLL